MKSLLPKYLRDKSNLTIEKLAREAFTTDLKDLMILIIDKCPENLLPLLAKQFHVLGYEGWNFARTVEEKRELLKNAFELHARKGTIYSLKRVLKILNLKGDFKEWSEYSGIPHHFKLILRVFDRPIDDETENNLLNLINAFKNERAKLETIEMYLSSNTELRTYCRIMFGEVITIKKRKVI